MKPERSAPQYYLGLPMWSHKPWVGSFFCAGTAPAEQLGQYASVFNSVEGNTTFYALPKADTVARWKAAVPADFRFVLKLPKTISHQRRLSHCGDELRDFFRCVEPLHPQLGPVWLQLPANFAPRDLPALIGFVKQLPAAFQYVLEVRHPGFFDQGPNEEQLLALLTQWHIDRVTFDSRALFSCDDNSEAVVDAQGKKPKLPVRPAATGRHPVVRFISHPQLPANDAFLAPWVVQVSRWLAADKQPYVFLHTPDNAQAPELAYRFHELLMAVVPHLAPLPESPAARTEGSGQIGLF